MLAAMSTSNPSGTDASLAGRVALITGANTGIGRVTALELARRGARLFLACRSEERTRPVLAEIRATCPGATAEFLPLDLADTASVQACAQDFLARGLPLHLLINNAGLAGTRGFTPSGFEYAFGVNHIGHFLLTQGLLDRMKQTAADAGHARIVTVASRAHTRVDGIDWKALRRPTATATGWKEYCVSKLANVLFSAELGRRLAGTGVSTYALHPGVIASDIWRRVPQPLRALGMLIMISNEEGAQTTLHCASAPALAGETGGYYARCQPVLPTAAGRDPALAAELWRRSEAWLA
jgi:retinol dehydrogenase-12